MKVVKSTGFVPLLDVQRGGIAGYPVVKARELLALGDKLWQEVEIPDTIETYEVDGVESTIEPAPLDEDNQIEIGEDWRDMHALRRLALAKQIAKANGDEFKPTGKADEKDAAATQIIEAELDRRNGVITTEERQIIPPALRGEGDNGVLTTENLNGGKDGEETPKPVESVTTVQVQTPVPNIPGQPEIFNTAGLPAEPVIDPSTGHPVADNTHGTGPAPFTGENGADDLDKAKNIASGLQPPPQNGRTAEEIAADAEALASGEGNGDQEGNDEFGADNGDADEEEKLPEIPENWSTLHHQTRLKLAKEIKGDLVIPDGKTATEVADDVIDTEVKRRAAAKQETPAT